MSRRAGRTARARQLHHAATSRWLLAGALCLALAGRAAGAERLGGVLEFDPVVRNFWSLSGTWRFPVGDPFDSSLPGEDGAPGFRTSRNVGVRGTRTWHQGADLENGRGGDAVCAAAHGIVISVGRGWNGGYGHCVVLAHRLEEGELAYSVYAHLAAGSVRVTPGESVGAGTVIGRVGGTGRVTTQHLHFEVRRVEDPGERWENTRVVDPLQFVRARLGAASPCSLTTCAVLAWAHHGALLARESNPEESLTRAEWWRALASAAPGSGRSLAADPDTLASWLRSSGVLKNRRALAARAKLDWKELAEDYESLTRAGIRLPAILTSPDSLETLCRARFGEAHPERVPARIARTSGPGPTGLDACLLLAAAAGADPERGRPKREPRPKSRRQTAPPDSIRTQRP